MLILKKFGAFVANVHEGGQFFLTNGDVVSPAYEGWANTDGYSLVAAPPAPPVSVEETLAAERAGLSLSFAQLLIGLVSEAWISEAEGEAWLDGALPASVDALIATLPADQRFAAKAHAKRPSVILRLDPLVVSLGAMQGKTEADLDTFFKTYGGL